MSKDANSPVRFCPICEGSMVTVEAEGVFVDLCQPHGIFLDHGELAVLERRGHRGVRIGMHESIRRDMARPFAVPANRRKTDKSAMESFLSLFDQVGPDLHRPEDADRARAPRRGDSDCKVVAAKRCCPMCNKRMTPDARKDVWGRTRTIALDTCVEHGVWLDHSALAILMDRSSGDARRKARRQGARAVERAQEEARSRSV